MVIETSIPTLALIIGSALIDSINPCAIGVLILLVSIMVAHTKLRKKMLWYGFLYIFTVFITYLAAGLGLVYFTNFIPVTIAVYLSVVVGVVVVGAGLLEIKDFFWYGKGFSLQIDPKQAKRIHQFMEDISTKGIILLGAFVALVELPCTGGPYLAVILILSQNFTFTAFLLMVLYNVIFILPLIVVLLLAAMGMEIQGMQRWKQDKRKYMRLAIGLLLVLLGWVLILLANGTINVG